MGPWAGRRIDPARLEKKGICSWIPLIAHASARVLYSLCTCLKRSLPTLAALIPQALRRLYKVF
eukprot:108099-Pyramimonas_sp.AAC.1